MQHVRRAAVLALSTAAHNKPNLIKGLLLELLPLLYDQTIIKVTNISLKFNQFFVHFSLGISRHLKLGHTTFLLSTYVRTRLAQFMCTCTGETPTLGSLGYVFDCCLKAMGPRITLHPAEYSYSRVVE